MMRKDCCVKATAGEAILGELNDSRCGGIITLVSSIHCAKEIYRGYTVVPDDRPNIS